MVTATAGAQPQLPTAGPAPSRAVERIDGDLCVAITRNNEERSLAEHLAVRGIGAFLPQRRETRLSGRGVHRRKRTVWAAMFPGFVFVGGGDDGREAAQQSGRGDGSRCVRDFITVSPRTQPVLRRELMDIELVLAHQPEVKPYAELRSGVRVVVKPGHAFQNMIGYVEGPVGAAGEFCVAITMLGQSLPVQIDPIYLEAMN